MQITNIIYIDPFLLFKVERDLWFSLCLSVCPSNFQCQQANLFPTLFIIFAADIHLIVNTLLYHDMIYTDPL